MSASSEIEGCTAGSDKDAVLASRVVVRERLQLMRTIAAHIYSLALRGCLRLVLRKKRHQGLERNIMSKEKCQQMHDDVKHVAARWRRSCSGSIVSDIIRRSFLSSPKGKSQAHAFLPYRLPQCWLPFHACCRKCRCRRSLCSIAFSNCIVIIDESHAPRSATKACSADELIITRWFFGFSVSCQHAL